MSGKVREFVRESNRIEAIHREPTAGEIERHEDLLRQEWLWLPYVENWVATIAGAPMRDRPGLDVRVGRYRPPSGGPDIRDELADLLVEISEGALSPYEAHVRYEKLHPFMDGNGRSGRAIWAWQMKRNGSEPFAIPFLHRFYYQALDASRT